ncbi:DUF4269 domain-containing protein [Paenibacillus glucanolyticus]|uniref:DUF4269 domain-containing protein n=1 Tax=Paenibacillus sp. LBL TaxID=2940563 RepID=UPI0024771629|nr:DUF4269 domain-containing protein [Paenibacillus sp. LBL]MDH6670469.1 hypothetical protein [Paenibacillus sp. LBL]
MVEDMDFLNIDYLRQGSAKQQQAAEVIDRLELLDHLKCYHPIWVGTIPIGIDIASSDLDIICQVTDFVSFERGMKERYGEILPGLTSSLRTVDNLERMVIRFRYGGWEFEVFAQPLPSTHQNGYRHMVVEYRLLKRLGEVGRQSIIELKKSGYKTEPAFAKLLNIPGDPYVELLKMYDWSEDQLDAMIKQFTDKENGYE